MNNLELYQISVSKNIREAIKQLDKGGIGFATIVNDNNKVIGIITDGDFRRAVLNGVSLEENVLKIANKNFKFLEKGYNNDDVENLFRTTVVQHIPILKEEKLDDIVLKESYNFAVALKDNNKKISCPVIIMAGGKGTRMEPFTKVLPKPLIPIGDKTMIEIIMNEYQHYGIDNFFISVNHKARLIKAYFDDVEKSYQLNFIEETKPLGTAGALKFLKGLINSTFFVSNCDIIIKDDYSLIYDFHKKSNFMLTVVASLQHHVIPYGVCEITEGGNLLKLKEKPEFDHLVNTGMYLLEPSAIDLIPHNEFFHITDLINKMLENNLPVGVYPVSEKSYIDVGQWKEYKEAVKILDVY